MGIANWGIMNWVVGISELPKCEVLNCETDRFRTESVLMRRCPLHGLLTDARSVTELNRDSPP